jgi:hypothetical protein
VFPAICTSAISILLFVVAVVESQLIMSEIMGTFLSLQMNAFAAGDVLSPVFRAVSVSDQMCRRV